MNHIIGSQAPKTGRAVENITDKDLDRILHCLANCPTESEIQELWEEKIDRALIIHQKKVPPDLVTIHSVIRFRSERESMNKEEEFTLVFPSQSNIDEGKISILTRLGIALVGARVGQIVSWRSRDGQIRTLIITSISYQPEASGDWHL